MRAISQDVAGGPEVLKLVEIDRPIPGPTEILVRVHAAGVNPVDRKNRARGPAANGTTPAFVLGFDVSGVVEHTGVGVTIFAPGDEVFGMPRFPQPAGAYAEFVTGPARHFAGAATFATGTAITLSATNGRDVIWSGACSSGGAKTKTCTFTITAGATITANVQ